MIDRLGRPFGGCERPRGEGVADVSDTQVL